MEQWYVVHSKPRQEQIAGENLRNQGYQCLFPRLRKEVRRQGQFHSVLEALFPGYLFIRLDLGATNLAPIRSTRGVIKLVRFGLEPAPVPESVIGSICSLMDAEGVIFAPADTLQVGQSVEVETGPFAGLSGTIHALNGPERVILLLSVLGGERSVTVPRSSLARPQPGVRLAAS